MTTPKATAAHPLGEAAGSAFVPIKQYGGETETASPLVWWLARLALRQMGRQPRPEVGDTVVEVTHLMGLARHRLGLLSAVGELVKVEADEHQMPIYTIRGLEGKETRWSNAEIVTIDRPNIGIDKRDNTAQT
jgi:hypothetical protein